MQTNTEPSWRQTARSELISGWQRWISFSCIWIWSCVTANLALSSPVLQQLPGVLSSPNEIVLIASAVVLAVILALVKIIKSIVDSRVLIGVAGVSMVCGSVLFVLGVEYSQLGFFVVGMGFGGTTIALLKIAWGEMYSRMSLRQGLLSMGYALTSSTLIVLFIQALPPVYLAITLVLVSVPCAPLVYWGTKNLGDTRQRPQETAKPVEFSLALLLLPIMVAISYGIVKGMIPWVDGSEAAVTNVAIKIAECVSGVGLIVFSCILGKRFGAAQIYAVALIFVVTGLVLVSLQEVPRWSAFFVHEVGFSLFYFFMVVYWGNLAARTGKPIVLIYTIGYGTFQVAQIIGSLLGYYVVGNQTHNYALLVLLSVVLAFFVVALLLFSNAHSSLRQWLIADEVYGETGDEIPIACASLSRQWGLSPREQEVLGLLARGRNASYVARTLCISLDTAKTHIKNIYRKLDVHAQQELIDLVDFKIREII